MLDKDTQKTKIKFFKLNRINDFVILTKYYLVIESFYSLSCCYYYSCYEYWVVYHIYFGVVAAFNLKKSKNLLVYYILLLTNTVWYC